MNVPDCTLTTCCYDLTKYHTKSRNLDETINTMFSLLKVPCYLVIFTDEHCYDKINQIRTSFNLDHLTKYIVTKIEDLPFYRYIDVIKKNREKYWPTKDERTCSESHMICCSKFNFVLETIELNPFQTTKFGWIDSNIKINFEKICENYNEEILLNILSNINNKFHIQILNVTNKKFKNYDNKKEYYNNYRWVVGGCLFLTNKQLGIKILHRLNEIFIETTFLGYGHGEEMLYLEVLDEFYDDIERSYGDYNQILNNYFYPTKNIYYIYNNIIQNYLNYSYHKESYDCCKSVLQSIENNTIEYNMNIYMKILYSYYMSSYYHNKTGKEAIQYIYSLCEKNNELLIEFNKNKEFYESQFKFCN